MDERVYMIYWVISIWMLVIMLIGSAKIELQLPVGEHTEKIKLDSIESVNEKSFICYKKTDDGGLEQCVFPTNVTVLYKTLKQGEESYAENTTNIFGYTTNCNIYISSDTEIQIKTEAKNRKSQTAKRGKKSTIIWILFIAWIVVLIVFFIWCVCLCLC